MFRQIVVPLDGSDMAETALSLALFWANLCHSSIVLVHIIEKNAPKTIHHQKHLSQVADAEEYLEKLAKTIPEGIKVTWHVHVEGVKSVASAIAEHALHEFRSDLVVMCSHGKEKTRRLFFGSLAQKVLGSAMMPVLVGSSSGKDSSPFSLNTILIPLDDTSEHSEILPFAQSIAKESGAKVILVSVIPTVSTTPGGWLQIGRLHPSTTAELYDIRENQQQERLAQLENEFRDHGVREIESMHLRGEPATLILEIRRQKGADLILMGTHGRKGMDAVWQGSVASRILANAVIPILIVPLLKNTNL